MRTTLPLLILLATDAFALTPADCIFYAPYDGSLDATQSAGSGKATVEGSLRFVEGIRGQGVLVGAPNTGLKYATDRNFRLDAGSISIWVKPLDWSDSDAAMRFFVGVTEGPVLTQADGGTFLWLYRFFSNSTYFLAWDSRGFPRLAGQNRKVTVDAFAPGKWTHLVGTWNGDEMRLYLNGDFQSSARMTTRRILRSANSFFTVGDPNRANKADTVLDELRIFNRALTAPEVRALHDFTLEAPADRQELTAVLLTGAQKIRAEVNAVGNTPAEAKALRAKVVLKPAKEERVLQEHPAVFADQAHCAVEFSTAELPLGDYRIVSTLLEGGKPVAANQVTVTLKAPPAWRGSKIGLSDKVPAPWTPLRVLAPGGDIECWGPRRYAVMKSLLPAQLETTGAKILAAPITLSGQGDGEPLAWTDVQTTLVRRTPARVDWRSQAHGSKLQVETASFLEFDGFMWTKLRVTATGPGNLSKLALEIPLKRPAATLMQTAYSNEDGGFLHAFSHRITADSQVWLGNEDGGLQLSVPSERNFHSADRNRQLEIVPQADRVLLRVNFITKETMFTAPLEYEFMLQLTPTRPRPAGWRMWRITPGDNTLKGVRLSPFYTEGWDLGASYPVPRPEFERMFSEETARGNLATPYLQPYSISPAMPDYEQFAAEWRTTLTSAAPPYDPQADMYATTGVCPRNASWSDYFVDTFFTLMGGKYKTMGWGALYFDVTPPPMCDNADHGCGFRDEYGVWQGETRYLDARNLQKRFYMAMQERFPGKLLFNHESGQVNMSQLSFVDGMIDGEHLALALPPDHFTYHKILPLDRVRAEYMGSNYGFVPIFLPEYSRGGSGNVELMKRLFLTVEPPEFLHLMGLLMVHDILPWPAYVQPAAVSHWWAIQDAFGFDDERLEFLPYWKTGDLVDLSPRDPNIVCSLYRRPGKLMLIVMNNTDEDRPVTLQLDVAKLGLPALHSGNLRDAWQGTSFRYHVHEVDDRGNARAHPEAVTQEGKVVEVPVVGGQVKLDVPKRNFRVLVSQ